MAYSQNVIEKANIKLDERRSSAENQAHIRKNQIFEKLPRAEQIEKEMSSIGILAAKAVFGGGNTAEELKKLAEKSGELKTELTKLLTSNGYEADALEPHYTCSICKDRGVVEKENATVYCTCFKQLLKECACEEVNRLSPLSLSTFDSFNLDYYPAELNSDGISPRRRMSQIFDYCKNYAENFGRFSKSIIMKGSTGLGKTHLSLSIANELLQKGFSVAYVSAPDIICQLERFHFSYDYESEQELLATMEDCDLLIIDDLGTEFASNFATTQIFNIFNKRILRDKPVVINTNLTIKELESAYTKRFVSRVMGSCDKLDFVGRDIRAIKN